MSDTLEELVIKLTADVSGLKAGFAEAVAESKKTSESINHHLEAMHEGFDHLKEGVLLLAEAILGELTLHAFYEMIRSSMEAIEVQYRLSERLQVSTDDLAALSLQAKLTGTSIESVTHASTLLQRQIEAAKNPTSAAAIAFEKLGIAVDEFSKKSTVEQMGEIADKLNSIHDKAERTTISMKLLGRGSQELDAFLREGSKGLEEAAKKIEEMGGAISGFDSHKVVEANDKFIEFGAIIQRVKDELASQLAPAFDTVLGYAIDFATETIKSFGGVQIMIASTLEKLFVFADGWVRTAQTIGGYLSNTVRVMMDSIKELIAWFNLGWIGIYKLVMDFVELSGKAIAKLLLDAAQLALAFDSDIAHHLISGAETVRRTTKKMAADATDDFNKSAETAGAAADELKDAYDNFFNVDASGSKFLQDLIDKTHEIMADPMIGKKKDHEKEKKEKEEDSTDDSLETYKSRLKERLDALGLYVDEDLVKEDDLYKQQSDLLKQALDEKLISEGEYQAASQDLNVKHQARLNAIDQDGAQKNAAIWAASFRGKMQIVGGILQSLSVLMQSKNREMFEIGKASAYASTVINTAQAAMGAYSAYASIPYVGPVLGAAAAAAAVAAGAIQLATISSTSFGGGGSASGSFSAGSPSGGGTGPQIANAASSTNQTGSVQSGAAPTDITINVKGKDGMSKEELINLSQELESLKSDGLTLGKLKFV